jgi:hypothetical protein
MVIKAVTAGKSMSTSHNFIIPPDEANLRAVTLEHVASIGVYVRVNGIRVGYFDNIDGSFTRVALKDSQLPTLPRDSKNCSYLKVV